MSLEEERIQTGSESGGRMADLPAKAAARTMTSGNDARITWMGGGIRVGRIDPERIVIVRRRIFVIFGRIGVVALGVAAPGWVRMRIARHVFRRRNGDAKRTDRRVDNVGDGLSVLDRLRSVVETFCDAEAIWCEMKI